MPVNYGSQIDEHHAVRRDAGMFDVSHMRAVDLARRRRARLPALRARQQRRQAEGARQGALFVPAARRDGGVLDDLIVYFLREDFFRIVVNAGTADKDIAWLRLLAANARRALTLTPRARPRDDRRAGAERAREGLAGAARAAARASPSRSSRSMATALGDVVHRAHRLHRRGRLRDHGAGGARGRRCGTRSPRPACGRAGSARATRCASKPG